MILSSTALAAEAEGPGLFGSLILGLIEGLTEFLPVSSTGHLIVANRLLGGEDPAYEVAIQAGAITAIVVLYWRRLYDAARNLLQRPGSGSHNLLVLLFVAAVPAAVVGLLFEDPIEALLFNPVTVAVALILGGVGLLWIERLMQAREDRGEQPELDLDQMGVRQALIIGVFQCLALIPGASRSGSTIAGALLIGFKRTSAAEFSFLVGLPILYGACLIKLLKNWERLTSPELLPDLLVGSAASFVSAVIVVVPFVRFLQRHTFRPFGWYRIFAGIAILLLVWRGVMTPTAE